MYHEFTKKMTRNRILAFALGAAMFVTADPVGALEDAGQFLRRDADAVIGDAGGDALGARHQA